MHPGPGFQRMTGQMILDVIQQDQAEQENAANLRRKEREQRAQAFAQVSLAQGTRVEDMTPTQLEFAKAHANALKTRGGQSRQGGFSIDPSARAAYKR